MTAASHPDPQPSQLRVLHVEDNELDAELVATALRKGGFSVSVAVVQERGEFEKQLGLHRPDIVIADYNLPQWKGMEALDVLRQQGLDIPLILVSGALGDVTAVECIKAGATDYVLKDGLARLPEAVRRALREKQLREQHRRAEELFRRAVESSPSGILMVDELCKILLVNTEPSRPREARPGRKGRVACPAAGWQRVPCRDRAESRRNRLGDPDSDFRG